MAHVPGLLLTLVWIMNKFHSMPNVVSNMVLDRKYYKK
jgi:hypothetical protein